MERLGFKYKTGHTIMLLCVSAFLRYISTPGHMPK